MSTAFLKTEAIVLQVTPFGEADRILTLFSPEGILKLFVKIQKKHYLQFVALTSPLTCGEYHYTPGKRDLHRFVEGSVLAAHMELRDRLDTLQAAYACLMAVQKSQWPGKSAPALYLLLRHFLHHFSEAENPASLETAFLVKILKHEGVLQLLPSPGKKSWRYGGECYDEKEAPRGALSFTEEEETCLRAMAQSRSLAQLGAPLPTALQKKIALLFDQTFALEGAPL